MCVCARARAFVCEDMHAGMWTSAVFKIIFKNIPQFYDPLVLQILADDTAVIKPHHWIVSLAQSSPHRHTPAV